MRENKQTEALLTWNQKLKIKNKTHVKNTNYKNSVRSALLTKVNVVDILF